MHINKRPMNEREMANPLQLAEKLHPSFLLDYIEQKAGSGVQILDDATGRLFWSKGLYRLFGLEASSGSASADLFDSLIHPTDLARVTFGSISRALKDGLPQKADFRIVRVDRTVRWVSVSTEALLGNAGSTMTLVSVFSDITEQKATTEHARRDDLVRNTILSMLDGMSWTVGADGVKQDLPQWRAKTGQTLRDSQGRGWLEAVHPDDRERVTATWRDAFQFRHEYNARYRLRQSSGEFRLCVARVTPFFDNSGRLTEWHGVCLDIEDIVRQDNINALPPQPRLTNALAGAHIRAGRAAINWSVKDLAEATHLTSAIIRSIEESAAGAIPAQRLEIVVAALQANGIDFREQKDNRIALVWT